MPQEIASVVEKIAAQVVAANGHDFTEFMSRLRLRLVTGKSYFASPEDRKVGSLEDDNNVGSATDESKRKRSRLENFKGKRPSRKVPPGRMDADRMIAESAEEHEETTNGAGDIQQATEEELQQDSQNLTAVTRKLLSLLIFPANSIFNEHCS